MTHPCSIGILADDLTSAADGAAPFVAAGLRATVGRGRVPYAKTPVLATDSGSRSASATEAPKQVARLTADLAACAILYKTVDSTLRGHVAMEIEASFRASGRSRLVFAPAFPAAGRTTVGGIQLVDGIPVAQSIYGADPVHPARHSALADLIPPALGSVLMLDAQTQDDLDRQIASLPDPESILWVGSPGMAAALAQRFAPAAQTETGSLADLSGDVLVVIGSANPRSRQQAAAINAMARVQLLMAPERREGEPVTVLRRIATEAATRISQPGIGAVIATGGDTMEAILDRLGIAEFEIVREFEPGFPLAVALMDGGRPLMLGMKAGGFGDDQTLRRAVSTLTGADAQQVSP